MPDSLRLTDGGYMRRPDVQSIMRYLYDMQCVAVVGFSNIGKSALLRLLTQPDVWVQELGEAGRDFLPVYVDCNRMLAMSDHGFYELVLRCLQESQEQLATLPALLNAYETQVAPASEFQVPLSFNKGLTAVLGATKYKVVLLLDEFDEPISRIDTRVLLNLRALQDRYNQRLVFVTATAQPLTRQRVEEHCGEFCELFSHHTWYLAPLTRSDGERLVRRYMAAFDADFIASDIDFIYEWAGGHPRMVEGVCQILEAAFEAVSSALDDPIERWQHQRSVMRDFHNDENLMAECAKIWDSCSEPEQQQLLALAQADDPPQHAIIGELLRKHMLLKIEGKPQPFCRLFAEFVQRKVVGGQPRSAALWVDIASGEVLVGGKSVETLTNLEYRLIGLLFQNLDKIVDKYQIVTHVWGEGYIDEVDDARIEKLVSRLRQKIETDASTPRFLTTVRGRGYKLALA
ncbi:MAG: winged helix-turn-helix domain-containing protein [Chloroflexota bacterium]|nr:winged helix-turn-helix domain-containing protein [Chloroflexota bacterium]